MKKEILFCVLSLMLCFTLLAQSTDASSKDESNVGLIVAILIGAIVGGLTSYFFAKRNK